MESQAISLTSGQADRLKHYADLDRRVRQHLKETEGQRDRLERCLEKLGTSASTLKDAALKMGANLQMMLHSMASDEVVKNVLASFAFESFEIISYKALLEHHLPDIIHKYWRALRPTSRQRSRRATAA
ncbi:MAG TPA: DUF892 family protein [Stellaceae bacterium]|nr:DUF892 family protein [Stellaceae bacterium]